MGKDSKPVLLAMKNGREIVKRKFTK
jgi:hypothetical protein